MNRCPITYLDLPEGTRYHPSGLAKLSPRLKNLALFSYSQEEQKNKALLMGSKLSIQGIQPKLSVQLDVKNEQFILCERGGTYIIKIQSQWPNLPENEDLTMKLAKISGIDVPSHGLVLCIDGTYSYWIERFDRHKKRQDIQKIPIEDFAQLSEASRDTKYDSSLEKVAQIIEQNCSFPLAEKEKLFRLTLFNFLVGNEDMHLKNYSLIRRDGIVSLSPAYDLLNTTLALGEAVHEESALPLLGKKNKWKRADLVDYLAQNRLQLPFPRVQKVIDFLALSMRQWPEIVQRSFLCVEDQEKYLFLVKKRAERLEIL